MDVTITARHCTLPLPVQRRVEAGVRRLRRFEPRVQRVDLHFRREHGFHHVEARLEVAGAPRIVAGASDRDCRTALDLATERLRRQLRNGRARRREYRAPQRSRRLSPAGGG